MDKRKPFLQVLLSVVLCSVSFSALFGEWYVHDGGLYSPEWRETMYVMYSRSLNNPEFFLSLIFRPSQNSIIVQIYSLDNYKNYSYLSGSTVKLNIITHQNKKITVHSARNVLFISTGCVFLTDDQRQYYGEIVVTQTKMDQILRSVLTSKVFEVEVKHPKHTLKLKFSPSGMTTAINYINYLILNGF